MGIQMANRIYYKLNYMEGKGSNIFKAEVKELRKRMNDESKGWKTFPNPTDLQDDTQKKWTGLNDLMGKKLWFGKPGKDMEKKGKQNDMRPYVTHDKLDPANSTSKSQMYTFAQLALKFASIVKRLDQKKKQDEIYDIYRLLARIYRPHTKLDHQEKGSAPNSYICWEPNESILKRINQIDDELLELLMITEGIARNEDVCYFMRGNNKSPGPGRQNNVGTMIVLIDLAKDIHDHPEFERLWNKLTPRVPVLNLTKLDLKRLCDL